MKRVLVLHQSLQLLPKTDMPARQACSMTQVFIDTMIVCSITGITIVMADMYVTEKVMHSPRYPLLISLVQSAQSLLQSAYFIRLFHHYWLVLLWRKCFYIFGERFICDVLSCCVCYCCLFRCRV